MDDMLDTMNAIGISVFKGIKKILRIINRMKLQWSLLKPSRILAELLETNSHVLQNNRMR